MLTAGVGGRPFSHFDLPTAYQGIVSQHTYVGNQTGVRNDHLPST